MDQREIQFNLILRIHYCLVKSARFTFEKYLNYLP